MLAELEKMGIINPAAVYRNLAPAKLVERALRRGEGRLSSTGALVVTTGKYTGRSPDDKFTVKTPDVANEIDWGKVNVPMEEAAFEGIYRRMCAYLQRREIFVFDGFAGADPKYAKRFRIINEMACQNMFIHQLLIRPTEDQLKEMYDCSLADEHMKEYIAEGKSYSYMCKIAERYANSAYRNGNEEKARDSVAVRIGPKYAVTGRQGTVEGRIRSNGYFINWQLQEINNPQDQDEEEQQ